MAPEAETRDALTEAADLLRAHGYAVVMKVEAERWDTWIKEGWARERELQDQLWQVDHLTDRCTALAAPSRPRWLREARRFLARYEWTEPLVFSRPEVSGG